MAQELKKFERTNKKLDDLSVFYFPTLKKVIGFDKKSQKHIVADRLISEQVIAYSIEKEKNRIDGDVDIWVRAGTANWRQTKHNGKFVGSDSFSKKGVRNTAISRYNMRPVGYKLSVRPPRLAKKSGKKIYDSKEVKKKLKLLMKVGTKGERLD